MEVVIIGPDTSLVELRALVDKASVGMVNLVLSDELLNIRPSIPPLQEFVMQHFDIAKCQFEIPKPYRAGYVHPRESFKRNRKL